MNVIQWRLNLTLNDCAYVLGYNKYEDIEENTDDWEIKQIEKEFEDKRYKEKNKLYEKMYEEFKLN